MEQVNHPSHYNLPNRKECIVEMEELYGRYITAIFCLTNAYKYLYRAGEKIENPKYQDIEKARWYFNYVNDHFGSAILSKGRKGVNLYLTVEKELKKYAQS